MLKCFKHFLFTVSLVSVKYFSSLRVSENYVFNTSVCKHVRGNLACESTFLLEVHVLSTNLDVGAFCSPCQLQEEYRCHNAEYYVNVIICWLMVFKVSTNLTASLGVMFIFQFPAIISFLDILYISFCVIRKFDSLNGHVAGRRHHHI